MNAIVSNSHNGPAPVPACAKLKFAVVDWPSGRESSPMKAMQLPSQANDESPTECRGYREPLVTRLADGSVASHVTNRSLEFHERGEWRAFPAGELCRPSVLEVDLAKDPGEAAAIRDSLANEHRRGKDAVAMFLGGRVRIIDPSVLEQLK